MTADLDTTTMNRADLTLKTDRMEARLSSVTGVQDLSLFDSVPLFRGLLQHERRAVATRLIRRNYRRNEVLFSQGQAADSLYIITRGIVAISRLSPKSDGRQTLAYLRPGDTVGEASLLEQQTRSATARALGEVEALILDREDFIELLEENTSVAIELSRLLIRRLMATNRRVGMKESEGRLIVVFETTPSTSDTSVAEAMTAALARQTGEPTVYTEVPSSQALPMELAKSESLTIGHPDGYDIVVPAFDGTLPPLAQMALMLDQMLGHYTTVLMRVSDPTDDGVSILLERAREVILVAPAEEAAWRELGTLNTAVRRQIDPHKTRVFTVLHRSQEEPAAGTFPGSADLELTLTAGALQASAASDLVRRLR